jgi:hypothetical protein
MHPHAAEAPFALTLALDRRSTALLHAREREATGAVVFGRNVQECLYTLGVAALADKEFWRFFEFDHGNAQERHDEDERAGRVPYIAPALVVGSCARGRRGACRTRKVGDEGPGEETGDELADSCSNQLV